MTATSTMNVCLMKMSFVFLVRKKAVTATIMTTTIIPAINKLYGHKCKYGMQTGDDGEQNECSMRICLSIKGQVCLSV